MTRKAFLFVCTGNICRSPTADGVMRKMVRDAQLHDQVSVDSAATHGYHVGSAPDERACEHARLRGYDLSALRARQVTRADFEAFDLILAMDRGHLAILQRMAPAQHRHKLRLFMSFAGSPAMDEVPDPYYGGAGGFEQVLDMIEDATRGLLRELKTALRTDQGREG